MCTPSRVSKPLVYPFPRGDRTFTSYPASRRAHASFHTRVSNGTGRFSTMISIFLRISALCLKCPQQPRQPAQHRRLSPMQSRRLIYQPARVTPIIEIPRWVLHIVNRPVRDIYCRRKAIWISISKKDKCIDGLRTALNIERKRLPVVVPRRSVGKKERIFPELVPMHHGLVVLMIPGALRIILE